MSASWQSLWLTVALLAGPELSDTTASTAVEQVLRQYEQAMCPLRTFEAEFDRIETDEVFRVRTYGQGYVYLDLQSGNWRIDVRPGNIPSAAEKRNSYSSRPESCEKCLSKDGHIFQYLNMGNEKSTPLFLCSAVDGSDRIVSTARYMGRRSNAPWPIRSLAWFSKLKPNVLVPPVFTGLPSDQLQQRFKISFVKLSGPNSILSFHPRTREDQSRFKKMDVLFSPGGIPLATKMNDTTGNKQVLILLKPESIHVNRPLRAGEDPLELELNEFERLLRSSEGAVTLFPQPDINANSQRKVHDEAARTTVIKSNFVEP